MIKISIIMPVYKVEKEVRRAVESMMAQTLSDIELIAVDDGSPDQSGRILDSLAREDQRIRVIHKENGGAPSARNAAIPLARGKYLYFADADDWAEPQMLERMYDAAERNGSQFVFTGYYIDTFFADGSTREDLVAADDAIYPTAEEFRKNACRYIDVNLLTTPWNKLYLADYIRKNDLHFPDTFWDDWPFNMRVIRDVEKVTVIRDAFYHFQRARSESETAKYIPTVYEKREEEHTKETELFRHWGLYDQLEVREMLGRRYIERFIGCTENLMNPKCDLSRREKKSRLRRMLSNPRVADSLRYAKPHSFYMKLMLVPIRLCSVEWTYAQAALISYVRRHDNRLFVQLKTGR